MAGDNSQGHISAWTKSVSNHPKKPNLESSLTKTTMTNWKWFIPEKKSRFFLEHTSNFTRWFPHKSLELSRGFSITQNPSHQGLEVPSPALPPAHSPFSQGFYPSLCLWGEGWRFKIHLQIPKKIPVEWTAGNSAPLVGHQEAEGRSSHPKYSIISGWTLGTNTDPPERRKNPSLFVLNPIFPTPLSPSIF